MKQLKNLRVASKRSDTESFGYDTHRNLGSDPITSAQTNFLFHESSAVFKFRSVSLLMFFGTRHPFPITHSSILHKG
jgi:hypothetical protein